MSIPLRIHGPAIIIFNGVSYYFKTGLKGSIKRNRAKIEVDAFGQSGVVTKFEKTSVTLFARMKPRQQLTLSGPFEWAAVKSSARDISHR